jgi:hypothetical protein
MTPSLMRVGHIFTSSDTAWMIHALQPVAFLMIENVNILMEEDFMVAPKADGQHVLLLCEENSFDLYLIHPGSPLPTTLDGRYVGPRDKSTGFVLKAEFVRVGMNTSFILAFDALAMEADIELDGKTFKAWDCLSLGDNVPTLEIRHELLT